MAEIFKREVERERQMEADREREKERAEEIDRGRKRETNSVDRKGKIVKSR